jgi:hypothetical protein
VVKRIWSWALEGVQERDVRISASATFFFCALISWSYLRGGVTLTKNFLLCFPHSREHMKQSVDGLYLMAIC